MIFDLICIAIVLLCCIYFARKGLLAGIFSFAGSLTSAILAGVLARALGLPLFNQFFRPSLERNISGMIGEYSVLSVDELLKSAVPYLPDNLVESMSQRVGDTAGLTAEAFSQRVVEDIVLPLILPIIHLVLFFIFFSLLRVLIGMLVSVFTSANRVPVLGTTNRILGAVLGVLLGLLYVFIIVLAIYTLQNIGEPPAAGEGLLEGSKVYELFSGFPFLS